MRLRRLWCALAGHRDEVIGFSHALDRNIVQCKRCGESGLKERASLGRGT